MTIFTASTAAELSADIQTIDLASQAGDGSGAQYTIMLTAGATMTEAADINAVNLKGADSLTLEGDGAVLDGANTYRGLFVYQGAVTINNLTIENAVAKGGAGGAGAQLGGGGGGGAGLGGGLFLANDTANGAGPARVTLNAVTFNSDSAVGGAGGSVYGGYGGDGGGMGGAGGNFRGGGGGIDGAGGFGWPSFTDPIIIPPQPGLVPGAASGGRGGVGDGGANGGGGGAAYAYPIAGHPGDYTHIGGGGGGIGGGAGNASGDLTHFIGGDGGFGGGGGWAGGNGGFGGGGAATRPVGLYNPAGHGGFGGGGGGDLMGSGGSGGFGAGAGGISGGGGLGAGGGIFAMQGASLTIAGGAIMGGSATGGAGGLDGGGGAGQGYGGGIFLQGGENIVLAPTSTAPVVISDVIADMTGSKDASGQTGVGSLTLDGPGTLALSAADTFTGGVTINRGTLALGNSAAAGTGAITFAAGANATLALENGVAPTNAIVGFAADDVINLAGLTGAYAPTLTGGMNPASFTLAIKGDVVTQSNADGSKLSSHFNIAGQSYSTIRRAFDKADDLTAVEHEGITGAPYIADTTLYSGPGTTGNIVSGNDLFYVNQASGLAEVDLDGSNNLLRASYAYSTIAPGTQTGLEADYVAGELAGAVATYSAPAGATYSSFAFEYDNNYQYLGAVYTFNYAGQTYDEAQYSYTAGSQPTLTEATFSGYAGSGGPSVASFFYDNTGASAGVQFSYTGMTVQAYTSATLLYNSANVLVAAEYSGYTTKAFSSQTTFYNASGVAQEIIRDFTSPTLAGAINGQAYNAYEKILTPTFTLLATAYHLDSGGNVYVGVANNVNSPTFGGTGVSTNATELSNTLTGGDWTITGGGTGETFNFAAFFNKAEITDYGSAFGGATDVVSVSTQDFADWTTMLADASASGGGANTTFTSTTTGDKLTLDGVTVGQLQGLSPGQASVDFLFHS